MSRTVVLEKWFDDAGKDLSQFEGLINFSKGISSLGLSNQGDRPYWFFLVCSCLSREQVEQVASSYDDYRHLQIQQAKSSCCQLARQLKEITDVLHAIANQALPATGEGTGQ